MSFEEKIIPVEICDTMEKSFLDYSMSVIVARALPDVRDGLKPVHRRILYTMFERNLTPEGPYRKCADIVGAVLGSYHPHGDASVYDALVRMAQDFSMRYEMIDGHGNFGSVDGHPAAAYRYTEAKMSKMAVEMLADIEKDTVDFIPNYDDRLKEPVTLPSRIPSLLVNGSKGIAVGMATNIPPHNLGEVIDCIIGYIDNPDITLEEMNELLPGPDFPTGGIIMGKSGIRSAYATGRGKIVVRGQAEIEEIRNNKFQIVITEIPYQVNKRELVKNIVDLADSKRVEGIDDIVDYSNRDGMKIVVELKKDVNPQVVLNKLYTYTQLQTTFGVIMLALVDGVPKVLNLKEIMNEYVKYQEQIVTRRTKYELKKAQDRAHILEGLKVALDYIDEVIKIIRASKTVNDAKEALMERFPIDEIQAKHIVDMRLAQLTGLERSKIEDEIQALHDKIADFKDILANEARILEIVKDEAIKIRDKYNDDRRTEISMVEGEVDDEDLIPEESCVLTLTKMGYIKRLPVDTYHSQNRGGKGLKGMTTREEDIAANMFICSSHDYIMYFTNLGRVYRQKAYIIPEGTRTSKGLNIINLLPLESGERVTAMVKFPQEPETKHIVLCTKNGIVKRSELEVYNTTRKGGVNGVTLDEGDELCWVEMTDGNDDLIVATKKGMAIRFNENDARPLGRTARGVKAITLREGDEVIGLAKVEEGKTLLTVTETGFGRRSNPDDYRVQNRGGLGLLNYRVAKYGDVSQIAMVDEEQDAILISDSGIIIRIAIESISTFARGSKGVRVMNMKDSKLIAMSIADKEEEKPEEDAENSENSTQVVDADGKIIEDEALKTAIDELDNAATTEPEE